MRQLIDVNRGCRTVFWGSLALLLTSCSSTVTPTQSYQLAEKIPVSTSSSQPYVVDQSLWLTGVEIADYLDQTGIVYQLNDVEYRAANQNIWMTPLSNQIKSKVQRDLTQLLPHYAVVVNNDSTVRKKLSLFVTQFQGNTLGEAQVAGHWKITDEKGVMTLLPFQCALPLEEDGYPELVRKLSTCLEEEEQTLSRYLQQK